MSFLSRLTIIIHRYFDENTFQYSTVDAGYMFVCFGPGWVGPWGKYFGPSSGREFRPVDNQLFICNALLSQEYKNLAEYMDRTLLQQQYNRYAHTN